jgi:hypothetical protein
MFLNCIGHSVQRREESEGSGRDLFGGTIPPSTLKGLGIAVNRTADKFKYTQN